MAELTTAPEVWLIRVGEIRDRVAMSAYSNGLVTHSVIWRVSECDELSQVRNATL